MSHLCSQCGYAFVAHAEEVAGPFCDCPRCGGLAVAEEQSSPHAIPPPDPPSDPFAPVLSSGEFSGMTGAAPLSPGLFDSYFEEASQVASIGQAEKLDSDRIQHQLSNSRDISRAPTSLQAAQRSNDSVQMGRNPYASGVEVSLPSAATPNIDPRDFAREALTTGPSGRFEIPAPPQHSVGQQQVEDAIHQELTYLQGPTPSQSAPARAAATLPSPPKPPAFDNVLEEYSDPFAQSISRSLGGFTDKDVPSHFDQYDPNTTPADGFDAEDVLAGVAAEYAYSANAEDDYNDRTSVMSDFDRQSLVEAALGGTAVQRDELQQGELEALEQKIRGSQPANLVAELSQEFANVQDEDDLAPAPLDPQAFAAPIAEDELAIDDDDNPFAAPRVASGVDAGPSGLWLITAEHRTADAVSDDADDDEYDPEANEEAETAWTKRSDEAGLDEETETAWAAERSDAEQSDPRYRSAEWSTPGQERGYDPSSLPSPPEFDDDVDLELHDGHNAMPFASLLSGQMLVTDPSRAIPAELQENELYEDDEELAAISDRFATSTGPENPAPEQSGGWVVDVPSAPPPLPSMRRKTAKSDAPSAFDLPQLSKPIEIPDLKSASKSAASGTAAADTAPRMVSKSWFVALGIISLLFLLGGAGIGFGLTWSKHKVERLSGPEKARSLLAEANKMLHDGENENALPLLKEAMVDDPTLAAVQRSLGVAYGRLGKNAEAAKAYDFYVRLAPNAEDADAIRTMLAKHLGQESDNPGQ